MTRREMSAALPFERFSHPEHQVWQWQIIVICHAGSTAI
jgi:hypothetical protein